ncbi:hypothetical protein TcasGA2_TC031567 [Tribolium castaneum]|uniref:RNA-directed DNA polymerase n=1 Tax=Tribolium castaneum TaxID=7070 RepID=A0A139WPM1_TRICA|nr:hypothetical protein TcasGA2_TC031567 [Tribolium castaneum]
MDEGFRSPMGRKGCRTGRRKTGKKFLTNQNLCSQKLKNEMTTKTGMMKIIVTRQNIPTDPILEIHDEGSLASSITIDPQLISDIDFSEIEKQFKVHVDEDSSDAFTNQPQSNRGKGRGMGKGKGKQLYKKSPSMCRAVSPSPSSTFSLIDEDETMEMTTEVDRMTNVITLFNVLVLPRGCDESEVRLGWLSALPIAQTSTLDFIMAPTRGRKRQAESRAESPVPVRAGQPDENLVALVTPVQSPDTTVTGGDAIPYFDPSNTEFNSERWCNKVDECRAVFHWTEETTVYFAITKLKGMAEVWYRSLPTMMRTWDEWKIQLQTAFPAQTDYYSMLKRMMARKKKIDEDYTTYYYSKLALLNELEITGKNSVSCIIGGITDAIVKTGAKAGQYQTPESLLQYLCSVTENQTSTTQAGKGRHFSNPRFRPKASFGKNNAKSSRELICFKCQKPGHTANVCSARNREMRCTLCRSHGHVAKDCRNKTTNKPSDQKTVALIGCFNGQLTRAYIDLGSSCTTITNKEIQRLKITKVDTTQISTLRGYGNGTVTTMGTVKITLKIDAVQSEIIVDVVSEGVQNVPVLVGRNFTELTNVGILKDDVSLRFFTLPPMETRSVQAAKVKLFVAKETIIPPMHYGHMPVRSDIQNGEIFVDYSLRLEPEHEYEIPSVVLQLRENACVKLPVINFSKNEIRFKKNTTIARGRICREEKYVPTILRISKTPQPELPLDQLDVGNVRPQTKQHLIDMLSEYRDCFALTVNELGCAKNVEMEIRLEEEKPFTFRPYRLAPSEVEKVNEMITELIQAEIIQESESNYASPIYEYLRMPFGLTNAPRVFQRFMNNLLRPVSKIAAVYLDDVLLHSNTEGQALCDLREVLDVLRAEGLTLNFQKCAFLKETVHFLGFEVSDGIIRPGLDKIQAVKNFSPPKNVKQIRQFIGLTGYFRHFVKNYALIARPLTNLTRKGVNWKWDTEEELAFERLKEILTSRPVLSIYDPTAVTELHTDASSLGVAGILLQYQTDGRLHPIAYYSRQTNEHERHYHSFELETLAVVESVKKFRIYLLDLEFTIVTDCNELKATSNKSQLIPRIARWWLQLLEFRFKVKYRAGTQMSHVDALSRNPNDSKTSKDVLALDKADWVLAGQLTDPKIKELHNILSKPPSTEYKQNVHKNYALREERVYRNTTKGLQWVVPKGMRQQVVRAAHDERGHFAAEKTLSRLSDCYWFPRMRDYVSDYIACCIPCIMKKKPSGKQEGFLHPIPKPTKPFDTIHLDHLGPFPRSKRGNVHIIACIDACTKFLFMRPVKSTKTVFVVNFLNELYVTYGKPRVVITDQGSCFTAAKFREHCDQNQVTHVKVAVATPRANGQVERLNRSILSVLMTGTLEDNLWDQNVPMAQFSINNAANASTGRTPSELMMGYKPRHGTDSYLRDEVQKIPTIVDDLIKLRLEASEKVAQVQKRQKELFDRKRKPPREYKVGDVVVVRKGEAATGESRKLMAPFSQPMTVKAVLPNDRYLVTDMPNSHRTRRKAIYQRVIAVDRMKPSTKPGGVSDESDGPNEDDQGEP